MTKIGASRGLRGQALGYADAIPEAVVAIRDFGRGAFKDWLDIVGGMPRQNHVNAQS
jgi:hypothetical protein